MIQEHRSNGGFSFPTTGGRLLLGPDPSEIAGMGNGSGSQQPVLGGGQGGGNELPESGVTQSGDIAPTNGGPTRQDLSGATIDSGVAGGAGGGGIAQPADPNHAGWTGVRDAAVARGFQFGADVTDDAGALDHILRLAQSNRQADYYAQLGRQLAPQAPAIQQYLQQNGQRPAPQAPPAWQAPEFDPRWASLVDRDPGTGVFVGKPGVPPEIVAKVNAFADWKQRFDTNPGEMINQAAEARAREIATATFREQFAAHNREQTIQTILAQNSTWLYQRDQAGSPQYDFQNRPMISPLGQRYMHHLAVAKQYGIGDPAHQDSYAKQAVRGEYAIAAQQAAQVAAGGAANPQTQQQQFRQNVNPTGAQPPQQRRANPNLANEPDETGVSLKDRLMAALRENGTTDADIMSSSGVE